MPVREWKEIQKMLRRIIPFVFLVAAAAANAQIFPDQVRDFKKSAPKTVSLPDFPLYNEYGFEAGEQADYTSPEKRFTATAWRFRDSTGAMAFFESRRPPGATPSKLSKLAVTTSDGTIFAYGNYVFQFTGGLPGSDELNLIYFQVPKLEQSPLPVLMSMLPAENLVPNSERYILGPVSLERFEPGISPSAAAFHLGAEGQIGKYQTAHGPLTLVIFNYPTPSIARDRYEEFQKLPGAIAKRTGPMVAVILLAPNADDAEKVLAQVRYEANLTYNERPPLDPGREASILISIFALAGICIAISLIAGIGFGAFRVLARKLGWKTEDADAMIVLHLSGK